MLDNNIDKTGILYHVQLSLIKIKSPWDCWETRAFRIRS